jgi:UDPglucose--hexose-1-phosphate uridylyltransferase
MPELRKDPIVGRWVIISTERGKRPSDFPMETRKRDAKLCPFCPTNESSTPPEIFAYRDNGSKPNTPGWSLRVIPNKFPALRIEGDLNREGMGIFDKMNGVGAHEVIVETPDHTKDLVDLELKQIQNVIWTYRERINDLKRDARFRHIMIFKNQGEAAGASLEHSHSQLIATPIVPIRILTEMDGAKKYYDYKERCIFCDMIRQEINDGTRIITQNNDFVALAPFASRFPFETWIMPTSHNPYFESINPDLVKTFSEITKDVLQRISMALNNPSYNYVLHSSPVEIHHNSDYHWHMEIMPKLTKVAGFEWGTGFYINPTTPEDAAFYLREIKKPQLVQE